MEDLARTETHLYRAQLDLRCSVAGTVHGADSSPALSRLRHRSESDHGRIDPWTDGPTFLHTGPPPQWLQTGRETEIP